LIDTKLNFSKLQNLPGERLLRWMSVKGVGSMSEFKQAVNFITNDLGISYKIHDEYFDYEKILDNLTNLLHIEFKKNEWSVSKASLNVMPGVQNRAILTGSRNWYLFEKLIELTQSDDTFTNYFIDSSSLIDKTDGEFQEQLKRNSLEKSFLPTSILFAEIDLVELESISHKLGIHLNSIYPIDYVESLPNIDEFIQSFGESSISRHIMPERFTNFPSPNLDTGFIDINQAFDSSTGRSSKEGYLYRFQNFGSKYSYYVNLDNKNYVINDEKIGLWKQISRLEKNYVFYAKDEFLSGTLIIPSVFKLPQIYLKTLGYCMAVPPRKWWPPSTLGRNPKMNYFYNVPENVANTLIIKKLNCRLITVNNNNDIENYFD